MTSADRLALLLAAAAALVLGAATPASAASWRYFDFDADAYYDAAAIDRDGNGRYDHLYFDLDNDDVWDTHLYNVRGSDALLETADYDMDENGEIEFRLTDGDGRLGFDYLYVNLDQNGAWDWFRGGTRRIVPGSNIDAITRTLRSNASRRLIDDFRARTGMSLLYPSFPLCC